MLQWRQALQSVLTEDLGEKTCPGIQIVPELGRRGPQGPRTKGIVSPCTAGSMSSLHHPVDEQAALSRLWLQWAGRWAGGAEGSVFLPHKAGVPPLSCHPRQELQARATFPGLTFSLWRSGQGSGELAASFSNSDQNILSLFLPT